MMTRIVRLRRRRIWHHMKHLLAISACMILGITPQYWLTPRSQRVEEIQAQAKTIISKFRMDRHPLTRRERFVSHSERIQRYMSIYYQHHDCPLKTRMRESVDSNGDPVLEVRSSGKVFSSKLRLDTPLSLMIEKISKCVWEARIDFSKDWHDEENRDKISKWNAQPLEKKKLRQICRRIQQDAHIIFQKEGIPILAQFETILGKTKIDTSDGIPIFGEWRLAAPVMPIYDIEDFNNCRTPYLISTSDRKKDHQIYPPIIWKFYDPFHALKRDILGSRTAWEEKRNSAVWITTESHFITMMNEFRNNLGLLFNDSKSQFSQRTENHCRYENPGNCPNTTLEISDFLGIDLLRVDNSDSPQISHIQSFKIIILDDLRFLRDPTLLWRVLWSSSVLVMVPPKYTTWAMEELLVPWIHFIPLISNKASSGMTLEAFNRSTTWIRQHDHQASMISERASLFIYDLVFHPDAPRDDDFIKKEIMKRYIDFWI